MCGIAGYIGGGEMKEERVLDALRHRGPDGCGRWSATLESGVNVQLLHTRLKIVDLTDAAAQPLRRESHGPEGALISPGTDARVIVFNGEIYNFKVLRMELIALGHVFRGTGDTEVVLHGYEQWGSELFTRLDGMFALAIYDGRRRRLLLARDHLGIKPLYFARARDGGVCFASEVRALVKSGMIDLALDPAALDGFLSAGSVQEPRTLFREIRAFPPGHFGIVRLDEGSPVALTVQPYWLAERIEVTEEVTLPEWNLEHRARLIESVRNQLNADVPVGIFLSGGIDSTLLMEMAVAAGRADQVLAFTLGGIAAEHDETPDAARSALRAGVKHRSVLLNETDAAIWAREGLTAMDQPSADGINLYLISRAARQEGLVVALAGMGADELHGAYGHARNLARLIRRMTGMGVAQGSLAQGMVVAQRLYRGATAGERLEALLAAMPTSWRVAQEKRRYFTASEIHELWPASTDFLAPRVCPFVDQAAFEEKGLEEQIRLAELGGYFLNTLLRDGDGATMANHQELRAPFTGKRYVEWILSAPEVVTAAEKVSKPRLVELLSPEGREAASRPKRGFTLDYATWLRGPFREDFIGAGEKLQSTLGLRFDGERMLATLRPGGEQKRARRLWALLALGKYLGANR